MQTYRVCGIDIPVVKRGCLTEREIAQAPFIILMTLTHYSVRKARHTQIGERIRSEQELEAFVQLYIDLGCSPERFRFIIR